MSFKSVLSVAGIALAALALPAQAEIYPNFCVDPTIGGNLGTPGSFSSNCSAGATQGFSADYLTGGYSEKISIRPDGSGNFDFNAMIIASFTAFAFDDDPGNTLAGAVTGLGNTYTLFAVVDASGTASGTTFTPSSATLRLYVDTTLGSVATGQSSILATPDANPMNLTTYSHVAGDEILVGTGVWTSGSGSLDENNQNFALTFGDFELTSAAGVDGEKLFISPRPFYVSLFSDGEISNGTLTAVASGDFTAGGDLSANFLEVPEPGSLALVGLALLGLGASRRRKE